MHMATTGTKAFALLAVLAALDVLGGTSASQAQFVSAEGPGGVRACSLSGVNPADHPQIFGDPSVAASYGFVQRNGRWRVAAGCRRGAAAAAAAAATAAASPGYSGYGYGPGYAGYGNGLSYASYTYNPVPPNVPKGAIYSDGKCWINKNGTNYGWGDCPKK